MQAAAGSVGELHAGGRRHSASRPQKKMDFCVKETPPPAERASPRLSCRVNPGPQELETQLILAARGGDRYTLAAVTERLFDLLAGGCSSVRDTYYVVHHVLALAVTGVQRVLSFIERLKEEDIAGIFVTHNLHDVYAVADRLVVMLRGQVVANLAKRDVTVEELIGLQVAGPPAPPA